MPLNNIEQEVIARFRKEYREAYKDILSEDVLKEGNKWFEDYLLSALSKVYEEGKRESVEKVRNYVEDHIKTWGTSYEPMVDLGEKIIKLVF